MGLATLFGMGTIGALIIEFIQGKDWRSVFTHGIDWYYQLAIGLTYGFVAALLALLLLRQDFMQEIKGFYADMFKDMDLSIGAILFISYCAGVGEELLFRGALQHYMGIYITSIVFVAIHGYLNPKDWRLSIYGVFMTVVIIGISFMYEQIGMISAMSAHFMIDVVLLYSMRKVD
jgi:membrane protease YdiL (CAAX protease family)